MKPITSIFAICLLASCSDQNDWKPPVLPNEGVTAIEDELGRGATIAMLPTGEGAAAMGWLCGFASAKNSGAGSQDASRMFIFDMMNGELNIQPALSDNSSSSELMKSVSFLEDWKRCST